MTPTKPVHAPLRDAEAFARALADVILSDIPTGYAFALCITSIGEADTGFFTHVSNCRREHLIQLLAEWREKLIARQEAPPGVLDREN